MGKEEKAEKVTFSIDKEKNFSEWFTEIIKVAELADIRYNVKGFIVFRPWSVLAMEAMYYYFERALQKRGHKPHFFPAVIPERNFNLESEHVEGFAPDVFWVTEYGDGNKLDEKLAMRPTSETAFYQMFAQWIRSHNDLPFKTYQRAQVWRHETKATRPFIRSREFYWLEAHDAFATQEDAEEQVREDMRTTEEVMHQIFGIPFMFFKRPQWDKFPGAVNTYGADTVMPDRKIIQQPSTHLLGQNFSKPFGVKFTNECSEEQYVFITCYGPAISRIFASVVAMHGDDSGLRFPFEIAPVQVIITPIAADKDKGVMKKAHTLREKLFDAGYRAEVDTSGKHSGEMFYYWEMKGVPLRIELGPKEAKEKKLTIFRRDTGKKDKIKETEMMKYLEKIAPAITKNLRGQADHYFKGLFTDAKDAKHAKKLLDERKIVRANFCSTEMDGLKCAEQVEKKLTAEIRGTRIDAEEKPKGKCIFCGKEAKDVVYIGRSY